MLMAAGMDVQQLKNELVEDVEKAWAAYEAEKDPVRSSKLKERWRQAKEELDSFRRQQGAGGEGPQQGCKV